MSHHEVAQGASLASILLRAMLLAYTLSALLTLSTAQLPPSSDFKSGSPSSIVLAKILQDSKQITELIRLLTHQKSLQEASQDGLPDERKREAAWDMDYGWGGGRFGKRMDTLGIGGRFGRSVDKRKEHNKA